MERMGLTQSVNPTSYLLLANYELLRRFLVNGNTLAILTPTLEADTTGLEREQRIVLAATDVCAGVNLCAALANQNVPREDELPVGAFRTKSFGLGIATVFGTTYTFFMCHFNCPP